MARNRDDESWVLRIARLATRSAPAGWGV